MVGASIENKVTADFRVKSASSHEPAGQPVAMLLNQGQTEAAVIRNTARRLVQAQPDKLRQTYQRGFMNTITKDCTQVLDECQFYHMTDCYD